MVASPNTPRSPRVLSPSTGNSCESVVPASMLPDAIASPRLVQVAVPTTQFTTPDGNAVVPRGMFPIPEAGRMDETRIRPRALDAVSVSERRGTERSGELATGTELSGTDRRGASTGTDRRGTDRSGTDRRGTPARSAASTGLVAVSPRPAQL